MYCENCGARIDDDSKFCENCGVLVKSEAEPSIEPKASEPETDPVEQEEKGITDLDQLMEVDMGLPLKEEMETTQIFTKESFFSEMEQEKAAQEIQEETVEEMEETAEETGTQPFFSAPIQTQKAEPEKEDAIRASAEPEEEQELELTPTEPKASEPEETLPIEEPEESQQERFIWKKEEDPEAVPIEAEAPEGDSQPEELAGDEPEASNLHPEDEEGDRPLFCMACGKRLPKGAAFCDICGTPTGEVAPVELHKRRPDQGLLIELAKGFFVRPAAAIEKAASENGFLPGIVFLLIKDVIVAVLSAVFMGKLSASLGVFGSWLIQGDPFGFGAKAFLLSVVLDALWIGLLFGAGKLFKGKGTIRELTGACGTASLLAAVLLIVTTILTALVPVAALCAALITLAATIAVMTKAAAQAMQMEDDLSIYAVPLAFACFSIIVFVVLRLLA